MRKEIEEYVKGCAECQQSKNNNKQKAPLHPIFPEAKLLFETISIDFITKLPEARGYDSIMTVVDHDCTKMATFIPCKESMTSEEVAALYLRKVFSRFGIPNRIISDRDTKFTSKFTKELCWLLRIKQNLTTAYHPRTDGQAERANQWVETYLRMWVNDQQNDWVDYLPYAEFAHNSWYNESAKATPFELLMGYIPRDKWEPKNTTMPGLATRLTDFKKIRDNARENMTKAQQKWIKEGRREEFEEGEQVWLEGTHIHTHHLAQKLRKKRYGPFTIEEKLSGVMYKIKLPHKWKIHPVFHIDLLTKYRETEIHGKNYSPPPPDIVDGEEEQEVEEVVNKRITKKGAVQYLVKWKGFPEAENEWLSKQKMHADQAIAKYEQRGGKIYKRQEAQTRRITTEMSSDETSHSHPLGGVQSGTGDLPNSPLSQPLELRRRAHNTSLGATEGSGPRPPTPRPTVEDASSDDDTRNPVPVVLGRTRAATRAQGTTT